MVIFPGCSCCGCTEDCCKTKYYSYKDTTPPGKWYDECPDVGDCYGRTGSCGNNVLEGFIVEKFCKQSVTGKDINATLRENSAVDDFGTIAGISTTQVCGQLGIITADHDITDQLVIEDDPDDGQYVLAKVPFRIVNANPGGPYGASNVVICWCCTEPDAEPCDCCKIDPPPPPPKKYGCKNGECVDVSGDNPPTGLVFLTYDDPTCGGNCGSVTGYCCTDYGLVEATANQCKAWGGTFHDYGEQFDMTCGCDCTIGGDYYDTQRDNPVPVTCDSGGTAEYIPSDKSWGGNVTGYSATDTYGTIQPLLDQGARVVVWVNYATAQIASMNARCCTGWRSHYISKYTAWAYNCRSKLWEFVASGAGSYDQEFRDTNTDQNCLVDGQPPPDPGSPTATPYARRPECVAQQQNPLP